MPRYKRKTNNVVLKIVIVVIILLAVGCGYAVWHHYHYKPKNTANTASNYEWPQAPQNNNISKTPPQQSTVPNQTTKSGGAGSSSGSGSSQSSGSSGSSKKQVTPFISTASPVIPENGQVDIHGYVQGVTESTGTCTLKMVDGSRVATTTHPGEISGTNTTCGQMSFGYGSGSNEVGPGTWQATLSYSSSGYTGSTTTNLVVQ